MQDVGTGEILVNPPFTQNRIHASEYALGLVTSCRTLRSSTLHLVVLVRVRSVRAPSRGPVAAISGFGLRGWKVFPVWLGFDVTAH